MALKFEGLPVLFLQEKKVGFLVKDSFLLVVTINITLRKCYPLAGLYGRSDVIRLIGND